MSPVSVVAISLILLLFFSELSIYMTTETVDHLFVDISRGEKLRINFNVTFPHIPSDRQPTNSTRSATQRSARGEGTDKAQTND